MAKYEITDNKTGKTVVVEGNKAPTTADAEAIFQKAGLRQSTTVTAPEVPEQKNAALSTVLRILNLPSDFLGGAIKGGRESVLGTYEAPNIGPDINFGKGKLNLGDLIHPSLVGGVRGLRDQTPVMQEVPKTLGVDPESLPGMGIGLAAEIATPDPLDFIKFGKVAEKIGEKAGRKVTESGENLVLKGLKPSPSQQKKFLEKTGESLSDWMSKNQITSDFVEQATKKIDEAQSAFDEIATSKDIKVNPETLLNKFIKTSEDIKDTIAGEMSGKAKKVESFFDTLTSKYGDSMTVADLTKERRGIDKELKDGQFTLPIEQASYLRSVRNAITESIQDAAGDMKVGGKSLKELGNELKKLYQFEDIAKQQSGLGKGTMNFGLTDLIAGGAGFATGGDPLNGLKNALIAIGTKRLVNSPKVIGKTSEGLQGLGSILKTPAMAKTLEALMRVGKEAGIQLPR